MVGVPMVISEDMLHAVGYRTEQAMTKYLNGRQYQSCQGCFMFNFNSLRRIRRCRTVVECSKHGFIVLDVNNIGLRGIKEAMRLERAHG